MENDTRRRTLICASLTSVGRLETIIFSEGGAVVDGSLACVWVALRVPPRAAELFVGDFVVAPTRLDFAEPRRELRRLFLERDEITCVQRYSRCMLRPNHFWIRTSARLLSRLSDIVSGGGVLWWLRQDGAVFEVPDFELFLCRYRRHVSRWQRRWTRRVWSRKRRAWV